MASKAEIMSFNMCEATCPYVDDKAYELFDNIVGLIKMTDEEKSEVFDLVHKFAEDFKNVGTIKLRDALDRACEEILELKNAN